MCTHIECVCAQSLKWPCGSWPNSANNCKPYLRGPCLPWGSLHEGGSGWVGVRLRSALNPRGRPPREARCVTAPRANKQTDFKLVLASIMRHDFICGAGCSMMHQNTINWWLLKGGREGRTEREIERTLNPNRVIIRSLKTFMIMRVWYVTQ